jgi:hypothetical protein
MDINATDNQIDIYNRNILLREAARKNINKCGLLGLCLDLGVQDFIDMDRFINVYPYNSHWVTLASMKSCDQKSLELQVYLDD